MLFVQCLKRHQNLTAVVLYPVSSFGTTFAKLQVMLVLKNPKEVLTRQVFEDEANILVINKCLNQLNNEVDWLSTHLWFT